MLNNKNTITNRDVAQELLKRSVYEFQTGNYSNALAIINQAIEVKPNYYEGLVVRASLIYPVFGNHQGIIRDCSQIIKINPHNQEAYNNRGRNVEFSDKTLHIYSWKSCQRSFSPRKAHTSKPVYLADFLTHK